MMIELKPMSDSQIRSQYINPIKTMVFFDYLMQIASFSLLFIVVAYYRWIYHVLRVRKRSLQFEILEYY